MFFFNMETEGFKLCFYDYVTDNGGMDHYERLNKKMIRFAIMLMVYYRNSFSQNKTLPDKFPKCESIKMPKVFNNIDNVDASIFKESKVNKFKSFNISYKVDHKNAGTAVIFNHINIEGFLPRCGREKDIERLTSVLQEYGFETRMYTDLRYNEVHSILKSVSEEDHSNNDCILIAVMSHGLPGYICASDFPYLVQNLWKPFLDENCKTLIGKPKLFFIQACAGSDDVDDPIFRFPRVDKYITPNEGVDEIDNLLSNTIPNSPDIFLYYSSFEDILSQKTKSEGTIFIQSFVHILEKYLTAEEEIDIFALCEHVRKRIAFEYKSKESNYFRSRAINNMPKMITTLTKKFIFKPKSKSNELNNKLT